MLSFTGTAERVADVEVEIGPWKFPPGSNFFVNLHGVHRNEKAWGSNTDKFDPSNFAPEKEKDRHPLAWVPFGFGPVACLGREIAMAVLKAFLCVFLKRFRTRVAPDLQVVCRAGLGTQPLKKFSGNFLFVLFFYSYLCFFSLEY